MIRICDRCEELTDDTYNITIYPVSTNGIVENYFICNDCADKIRAFIKMDESTKKQVEYLDWYFTCDDGTADKDAQKAWLELRKQIMNGKAECNQET